MSEQAMVIENTLEARFPGIVSRDERKGYEGYIVQTDKLVEAATRLRDEFGYDYLSSITGVDYLPEDKMEVVYHLYKSTGGSGLVLKAQTSREAASVPSLMPVYPGADFQEREAWDLFGIHFEGHPDLRRIYVGRISRASHAQGLARGLLRGGGQAFQEPLAGWARMARRG